MKPLVVLLLLFAFTAPLTEAQTKKDSLAISKLMKSYYSVHLKESWPDLVEFLYPRVFEVYAKETLKSELSQPKPKSEMSETKHDSLWTLSISKPFKHKKITYYLVSFNSALTIHSLKKSTDGKCDQRILGAMLGTYQKQYGEGNVVMKKNECQFKVLNRNEVIIVDDPKFKKLTLIEKKPDTASLIKKIFPEEAYNHFFPADSVTK